MVKKFSPRSGSLGYFPKSQSSQITPSIAIKNQVIFNNYYSLIQRSSRMVQYKHPLRGFEACSILNLPELIILKKVNYYTTINSRLVKFFEKSHPLSEIEQKKIAALQDTDITLKTLTLLFKFSESTIYQKEIYLTDSLGAFFKNNLEEITNSKLKRFTMLDSKPLSKYTLHLLRATIFDLTTVINTMIKNENKFDVVGLTKGHGFTGIPKRFGVKLKKGKHSRANKTRHIGSISGRGIGRVNWTVPQPGHMGHWKRTVFGLNNVSNHIQNLDPYQLAIKGSVPGPKKSILCIIASRRL